MWAVFARGALLYAVIVVGAAVVIATGGCNDPARVTVVAAPTSCGQPLATALQGVKLHAYAPSGEVIQSIAGNQGAVEIADLPADTVQIGLEVFGANSQTILAGKSAPLPFGELRSGDAITVFMAPPDGMCPTGDLTQARSAPLVARAGEGAIVVGGDGPVASAEYFDPTSGAFEPVEVPPEIVDPSNGLAGFVLTELPDGRVVMTGGARLLSIFDPAVVPRAFSSPQVFAGEQRAFHAAIALDRDHVMLAGGCTDVANGACAGLFLTNTRIYALADLGHPVLGPMLASDAQHVSSRLVGLGVQADGRDGYLLAGGVIDPLGGTPFAGERFETGDSATTPVAVQAQAAALDGGAVLTAYAPDAVSSSVAVVVPDGAVAAMSNAPPQQGTRLVALEDGTVASIGGDRLGGEPDGAVHVYVPSSSTWRAVAPDPSVVVDPTLSEPSLLRLADGSVLVIGGGAPAATAWRYRPSLIGASSGTVAASFPSMGTQDTVLIAPDPRVVTHELAYELTGTDDALSARALVGGPRMATGSIQVSARVAGGIALIGQQLGPGRALVGHLAAGVPARIDRLHDGTVSTLCEGQVPALPDSTVADVALVVTGSSATLSLARQVVASCNLDGFAADTGSWGMAPDGAGAKITVFTVTATRTTQP